MSSAMEDLAKKFDGFDVVMTRVLDKLTDLEAWRDTADAAMTKLLERGDASTSHSLRLDAAPAPPPHPPPRPSTVPPHPPPRWTNPFDLNMAPQQDVRPPARTLERPGGHRVANHHRDAGGGLLGAHPPHPVTGMSTNPLPKHSEFAFAPPSTTPRASTLPKIDFPKFDGENLGCGRIAARCFLRCMGLVTA